MRLTSRIALALIAFFPALLCKGDFTLSVAPTNIYNSVRVGSDAPDQSFLVSIFGFGFGYSNNVTTNEPTAWLIVASNAVNSGASPTNYSVLLSYASSNLPSGVQTGSLTVTGTSGFDPPGTQVVVTVTLNVIDFSVSPTNLTNAVLYGFNVTSQTFGVSAGQGAMSFTASTNAGWLNVRPSAGSVAGGLTNTLTNIYLTASLAAGDYEGRVTITTPEAGGLSELVTVPLRVYSTPIVGASPSVINQFVEKGGNPTGEYFDVWNASAAPVVGIEYSLAVINDPDNIVQGILPAGGISTGQHDTIGVYFRNLSAYAAGSYTARVAIVATNYGSGYWGSWTGTNDVNVVLLIAAPDAPAQVNASKDAYDDRVALNWRSVPSLRPVSYNVLRHVTFDPAYAETLVSGLTVTNYNDVNVLPGLRYYYWVQTVNIYVESGTNSVSDSGYRRLAAPGGLFASDGQYTNKVVINWADVDGAVSYYVYRSAGGPVAVVHHTAALEYEDNTVSEGVEYTYYVQAANPISLSALSSGEKGYLLARPSAFSASDGQYALKIVLTWNAVPGAALYEVWRSTRTLTPPYGGGAKIAEVSETSYTDSAVTPATKYYYWLKSRNATALSGFSAREEGYAATAAVDLSLWGLVVQPRRIGPGAHPRVVSFRLANNGGTSLEADNGTLQLTFYSSTNNVFGDGDDSVIGTFNERLTLSAGSSSIFRFSGGNITLPAAPDSYYLFMRLNPVWPSTFAPASAGGWVTQRTQPLEVSANGSINYLSMNDYDGDGISDLVVHALGLWDARSVDGFEFARNYAFGGNGAALMGDYDGDRKTDPVIYDESSGLWQALLSGSGYAYTSGYFGGPGSSAVPGDYDGDGKTEAAVFDSANSLWYALKVGGGWVMQGIQFGNVGFKPVIGDYDGDGLWDLALYDENNGLWFIRSVSGTLILTGAHWGGQDFSAVPGDYDGDGLWDLAVFDELTGRWYIRTVAGDLIANGILWGAPGYRPVAGDFDGDGIYDLAVYNLISGKWFIRTLAGSWLLLDATWGGAGRKAVGGVE